MINYNGKEYEENAYMCNCHSIVQQKLTQHCKSNILQWNKFFIVFLFQQTLLYTLHHTDRIHCGNSIQIMSILHLYKINLFFKWYACHSVLVNMPYSRIIHALRIKKHTPIGKWTGRVNSETYPFYNTLCPVWSHMAHNWIEDEWSQVLHLMKVCVKWVHGLNFL